MIGGHQFVHNKIIPMFSLHELCVLKINNMLFEKWYLKSDMDHMILFTLSKGNLQRVNSFQCVDSMQ